MPKASINAIITILRNAQRLGIDVNILQQRVGISPELLADTDKRVDSQIGFRLMEEAEKLANDPLFGLHHGSQFQPADMGLVGYLVLNAPTAKQAVESYCKYQKIYGEGMQIQTNTVKDKIKVTFTPHPALDELKSFGAYYSHMSGFISTINWLLNKKIQPLEVNIAHKAPDKLLQLKEFSTLFGQKIHFSSPNFSILYNADSLSHNVLTNNPELFKLLEHRAEKVMQQFGDVNDLKSQVASSLLKSLDSKKPSLENIAKQLHKSARTVQRVLKSEGTSFQEVLNEVRQSSAKYYLENSVMNIDEIAFLLGYSDSSAFRKSFKKNFQHSPESYRKQLALQ